MIPSFLICLTLACLGTATSFDEKEFQPADTIERDVAIIGGGASGTYAAVRLREDYNTSIVVIEAEDHLGGHVNTYTDPITNTSVDYGVLTYLRYGNSMSFFERFNLSTTPYTPASLTDVAVDITSAELLSSYLSPAPNATLAALERWLNLTSRYSSIMIPGFWNFPSGDDIPEELLLPFGVFAEKYGIQAAVPTMMSVSNVGVGGVNHILTLYVMIAFGEPVTRELLNGSLFVPRGHSNNGLYQRALSFLRKDVLLQTRVIESQRRDSGVSLVVRDTAGCKKLVKAKRLLVTLPPSVRNLQAFELNAKETEVFDTWTDTWSFAGIARIPSLPVNYSISYIPHAAAPDDYLALRDWSWTLRLDSTGPKTSLFSVLFATNYSITHEEAKSVITSAVKNLTSSQGAFPTNSSGNATVGIELLEFVDHNSVLWRQSVEELRAGFVQKLYGLQGYRGTWYTGGLWDADYTGHVWAFTDTVLPRLVASLRK